MKYSRLIKPILAIGAATFLFSPVSFAAAPPAAAAMRLHGKLKQGGSAASGEHEFRFRIFTDATGNVLTPKTQPITVTELVVDGDWQTVVDLRRFGGEKSILDDLIFPPNQAQQILADLKLPEIGDRSLLDDTVREAVQHTWRALEGNWLEMSVRRKGAGEFVPLLPRQKLGSSPRAMTAFTAEHAVVAGTVAEGGVDARAIQPGAVTGEKLAALGINSAALANLSVIGSKIAPQTVVRSLNGLRDDVTISAGAGISLGTQGNAILIAATGGGGGSGGAGSIVPLGNFLGGGADNVFGANTSYNFLGGGEHNKVSDGNDNVFLGGGEMNRALERSDFSVLPGGYDNQIAPDSDNAVIGGGSGNRAEGSHASILSGQNNSAASYGTVGGGALNKAENMYASVPGGFRNDALGVGSFAAGYRAKATHPGSFVWNSFGNNDPDFGSSRGGEFAVRAYGGVRFETAGRGIVVDGVNITAGGGGGAGSVNTAQLADRAVTLAKIAVEGNPADGMFLSLSGGSLVWTPAPQGNGGGGGGGWALGGNAGTDPATAFLGTVDNKPLNFRVNNLAALTISHGSITEQSSSGDYTVAGNNVIFNPGVNYVGADVVGAMVGGGAYNPGGNYRNFAAGSYSTIGGGISNQAGKAGVGGAPSSGAATVGGGVLNAAMGDLSFIGGGNGNIAGGVGSSVLGGRFNRANANGAVVGGGYGNRALETRSELQGYGNDSGIFSGQGNVLSNAFHAVISGGATNSIQQDADGAVIAGGRFNEARGADSVIPGGRNNQALGELSFAGGNNAMAFHKGAFVWNDASGIAFGTEADNEFAVRASGGIRLRSGTTLSTISDGVYLNTHGRGLFVDGERVGSSAPPVRGFSLEAMDAPLITRGWDAFASGPNTGVGRWGLFMEPSELAAGIPNIPGKLFSVKTYDPDGSSQYRLAVNSEGRVGVGTAQPGAGLHVSTIGSFNYPQLCLSQPFGSEMVRLRLDAGFGPWDIATGSDGELRFFGSGMDRMVLARNGTVSAAAFNQTSDRNAKEAFRQVNAREALAKVAAMPISEWQFKNDETGARHIGPMAQDFHAAFGTGQDDRHIATVDADGVALAAIQGLHQEAQEKEARIRELEQQVRRLEEMVRKLAGQQ